MRAERGATSGSGGRRRGPPGLVALFAAFALLTTACHSGSGSRGSAGTASTAAATTVPAPTTATVALGPALVLGGQGGELDAYSTTRPFASQTVVPSPDADSHGVDVTGQICFDPTDPNRFVAVDRTAAADGQVGWGVFELSGNALGKLSAKETARLVPTFQTSTDAPSPFGCDFLSDGRLLTTDLGNRTTGPANGQLVEWFPPFDGETVASCKVAVNLAAPEGVLVNGQHVYVAESRDVGVTGFVTATLPTSAHATGGCSQRDATQAGLAVGVVRAPLMANPALAGLTRPAGVARARNGDLFVSSPFTGVIAEVGRDGQLLRRVLTPPAGATLGRRPLPTGTPAGIDVGPDGSLFYADTGLVVRDHVLVPGTRTGTIRRIAFVGDAARPPDIVDSGLDAPLGVGIWVPKKT